MNIGDLATFHAASVSLSGEAILLPGPKRCGKSSLTLGLMLKGCRYLGEDVAVLEHHSLHLMPSGDGVSMRRQSLSAFPEIEKHWRELRNDNAESDGLEQVAFATVEDIGSRLSEPCQLGMVVFPVYDASVTHALMEPVSPGRAVLRLLEHCITLGAGVERGIDIVVSVVNQVRLYTLRYRDVREGCDRILELAKAPQSMCFGRAEV